MALYRIEVIAKESHADAIKEIAKRFEAVDLHVEACGADGRQMSMMLLNRGDRQGLIDALQNEIGAFNNGRIIIMAAEATIPQPQVDEDEEEASKRRRESLMATREELYTQITNGANLDIPYVALTVLSTVVAAIGLIEDNIAAVIGAMVIAPLLGPNLAFSLGSALGDSKLMLKAVLTGAAGLGVALAIGAAIGLSGQFPLGANELVARTSVGLDGIVLALASGAAAVLTMTSGLPIALVGVMVAVALLPPTATAGIMVGAGHFSAALGAALLLTVNIVCVNLASLAVFLVRGIRPRTWLERRAARQSVRVSAVAWTLMLIILTTVIIVRQPL